MDGRYNVYLENNHHYMLTDSISGETFYTPAQEDANALAGKLNQKDNTIRKQQKRIQELEALVKSNGLTVEENHVCNNCENKTLQFSGECWCELHQKPVAVYDSCNSWETLL